GQIDKAVKEYLRIVQEDPKDVRGWLKIGDLYAKKGAKQDATDTYLKVARFYHDQGFFLKAVAVYKQILKLDPRLVDVILKLAELYRQLGLMSDAMQHYESVAAHFHREGNTKEALDTVKKLVDLDPENIATRIKLAELYSKEGLVEEAVLQFNMACEQLRRQGRQDDFVKVAERLLWHKPDNHALNRELAGLYLRRNDPRRALQKLQACFKADPRDVETLGLLALAFQALDQKAKTVSVLKELARIHVENKHRDKAGEVYRKILEIVPNDTDAMQYLGVGAQAAAPPPQATPTPTPQPPPMPPQRNTPPPPPFMQPRGQTPLPSAVRAASEAAKFNITSDLPSLGAQNAGNLPRNMTGSMPLVDESSLSGVDFALPEYDDADFSADMEPPPDPRRASAAGERHAEEISKILAETDVYVKYGLHQKAVDHLRRVFTLDEQNVEAHERLKDIFISQGREDEAVQELLKLAELIAPTDPDRAEQYLQDLLAMNGTHTGAFDLARRFRLRVARMSSVSAEVEYSGGGVHEIDPDLEDLDLNAAPPSAMGIARGGHRDSIDEFDPDELLGRNIAHGSPAPGRVPEPDQYGQGYDQDFGTGAHSTRQVSPEEVQRMASGMGEYEDEGGVLVDTPPRGNWDEQNYAATRFESPVYPDPAQGIDDQLDDQALGEDIDQEVAAELGGDLPFDPDDARAFDAEAKGGTDANYVNGFEETDMPPTAAYDDVNDPLAVSGSYDPYGTEAGQPAPGYESTTMGGPVVDDVATPVGGARAESLVEDDLEEVDFYVSQGMYAEATESLRNLWERYPNHPLLIAKHREIESLQGSTSAEPELTGGTDALEIDEIEEVNADDLEEVDERGNRPAASKRKPTVMLEKPLDESDAETHYDLGLAYKEMGLFDDAVKAFEKVLRAPGREIQCRVMIGVCFREQGNPNEAIQHFKQGLHANGSDRERLSLYYEIGVTYEAMGDYGEALYYFEAVVKRDPHFADAAQRAESLRMQGGQATHPPDDDL
ncbi:MAG TPA: tetratricopeptide repeat protein, partial [Kofleriaceae bacterium]|nr:tetratricopeptide repeat protein [Kofleriaceae bacterium]